jgi:flavin reductase (DIM6/NTAB) family NADH-FMN oxidoreductase RutF
MSNTPAKPVVMDEKTRQGIAAALGRVPSGLYILTAKHEDRRAGMLVSWVQQACFQPPMVSVAIGKGRQVMPLLSESRKFGLCQLSKNDKLILKKFAGGTDLGEDPFLGLDLLPHTVTGVPILAHTAAYLECEMVCHMDVDGDHDIFVGVIRAGAYFGGEPHVHLRENGMRY